MKVARRLLQHSTMSNDDLAIFKKTITECMWFNPVQHGYEPKHPRVCAAVVRDGLAAATIWKRYAEADPISYQFKMNGPDECKITKVGTEGGVSHAEGVYSMKFE